MPHQQEAFGDLSNTDNINVLLTDSQYIRDKQILHDQESNTATIMRAPNPLDHQGIVPGCYTEMHCSFDSKAVIQ